MKAKNLSGQTFGRLKVIERDNNRKGGHAYWICQCDCGKVLSIAGTKLRTGQKSCGCGNKENIIGKKFGRLLVLKETKERNPSNGSILLECKCDCGNSILVRRDQLISNKTKSCGCLKKEQNKINLHQEKENLINKRFGKLTVIELDLSKTSRTYWLCKCDCGNVVSVRATHLKGKEINSCGCQKQSNGEFIIEQILKENNINYKKEYKFNNLFNEKTGYQLRFDFALFDQFNTELVCLIEFDGAQHFQETNYYFNDNLEEIQRRDQTKNDFCQKNSIPLFRIHYKQLKTINSIFDILNNKNIVK